MDVVEDSDGLAESESELAPCPYCDGKDCKHEVLWHSACNCDWDGLVADKTRKLSSDLETALGAALEAQSETWPDGGGSDALQELIENARECFDGSADSLVGLSASYLYWLKLAEEEPSGSSVIRVDWDGGGPGMSDTFFHVYFQNPPKGLEQVISAAKSDLEFLKEALPKKARKKKKAPARKTLRR